MNIDHVLPKGEEPIKQENQLEELNDENHNDHDDYYGNDIIDYINFHEYDD